MAGSWRLRLGAWIWMFLMGSVVARADDPVVLADFEGPDYGAWEVKGEAFGIAPAPGTLPGQMQVSGFIGKGLVNSFRGGDDTTGELTSPEFTMDRDAIHFLIGGGGFEGKTCLQLLVDGKPVRESVGPNKDAGGSESLRPARWDVADLKGKTARLRVVDAAKGGWGHINVDQIVMADADFAWPDDRDALLAKAAASVDAAVARAAEDPARPAFHFLPPANWMNDPNGTMYHDGYHHVFYQHNPYGDAWGHMHWGHARSKDLVHWEDLPIALWPSERKGEEHVFSGGAAKTADGSPVVFYTSVGPGRPNEQWAALPVDPKLESWKKHPANPIFTTQLPDGTKLEGGMRDPFPFRLGDETYLVVGGDTKTESVIPLFQAADGSLSKWDYKGVLWRAPKSVMEFPECPNYFPLGGKFVLLMSPYRPVEYRVGTMGQDLKFQPETEGKLDVSDQFYATNIAFGPDGRCLLYAWIRGFPEKKGWNGCLALPRVLTIGPDDRPRQHFVSELEQLRGPSLLAENWQLIDSARELEGVSTDQIEVKAVLGRNQTGRIGLRLGRAGAAEVVWDGQNLEVGGVKAPVPGSADRQTLDLHIFLDRSVIEVLADDGAVSITRVVPYRTDGSPILEAFSAGGFGKVERLEAWPIDGIWKSPRHGR